MKKIIFLILVATYANAPNSTAYFSIDSNKPGYKDSGGTFHAYY